MQERAARVRPEGAASAPLSPQPVSTQTYASGAASNAPLPARLPTTEGDRVVWAMRAAGDMQIHCTIHLQGHLDEARLARAIRLSLDVEPVLGCRLQDGWWNPHWQRRDDLDEVTLCTLLPGTSDKDLQAFLTADNDPYQDPLIQARVFRGATDTLCLKINHLVADAGGSKQYAYLLASLYNELRECPGHQVTPRLEGSREMTQVLRRFSLWQKLGILRRSLQDTVARLWPPRFWKLHRFPGPPTQRVYAFRHLDPSQMAEIKAFARQHNATLNDVVMAAYLRALHATFAIPAHLPKRMMQTVDLRRYTPGRELERICNLSNFMHPNLGLHLGADLSATTARMRDTTHRLKADYLGLGELPIAGPLIKAMPGYLFRRLIRFTFHHIHTIMPPVLTNMGPIDTDRLSFDDLPVHNAFLTASVLYPPFFAGGFSGFGDRLTLSFGYCQTSLPSQVVNEVLDQVVLELTSPSRASDHTASM